MKKIFIPLIASMFFFSTCAIEEENDPENASVSLSDNAPTFTILQFRWRKHQWRIHQWGHEQPNDQRNSDLSGSYGCPLDPVLRLW